MDLLRNFFCLIFNKENFSFNPLLQKIITSNKGNISIAVNLTLIANANVTPLKIKYLNLVLFGSLNDFRINRIDYETKNIRKITDSIILEYIIYKI